MNVVYSHAHEANLTALSMQLKVIRVKRKRFEEPAEAFGNCTSPAISLIVHCMFCSCRGCTVGPCAEEANPRDTCRWRIVGGQRGIRRGIGGKHRTRSKSWDAETTTVQAVGGGFRQ